MRYYTIVNEADVIDDDEQKDPVRLALTVFDNDVRLYLRRDRDPNNTNDEEAFAKQIDGTPREPCTLIAIGNGAKFALDTLALVAKRASAALSAHSYRPFIQLILVAPICASGEFVETAHHLSRGALAASVCHRVVVLHADNGGARPVLGELAGTLGLWGPAGTPFSNVLALDVSVLLLTQHVGLGAYLKAPEVLGLIARAAGGASDETLRRFARRGCRSKAED
ncbi:MAG: hypothetical protein JNN30_16285 [Rhodanobacteraceae bacterium]|nr:hypothetical protein [Rhodanobacteraceae bacterium]